MIHRFDFRNILILQLIKYGVFLCILPAVFLTFILTVPVCYAASENGNTHNMTPDVLILVMSGLGRYDQVSINYNSEVPVSKAQIDLNTLARVGHWAILSPSASIKSTSAAKAIRSTSVSFQSQGILNQQSGTLSLEPLVNTFKRFKYIEVDYITPTSFTFHGLKDFENKYVKIILSQSGSSYRYRVRIKNSSFTRLSLPLKQSAQTESQSIQIALLPKLLIILGIAILGAIIAYLSAAFISKKLKSKTD